MKRSVLERTVVVALFILVMTAFSFAERDTQKLFARYNTKSTVEVQITKPTVTAKLPVASMEAEASVAE
jgi:hypothetical protein